LDLKESLICPKCSSKNFIVKREATYLYTYKFNPDNLLDVSKKTEDLPFLFDNREKETSNEYIECEQCGAKYPLSLDSLGKRIDLTILRKAIRADNTENPGFLG
jgi:DNA-directed RNA polymerase subunit RPC12/RpoP